MNLSPDGGVTPAPTEGDLEAMNAAYTSGMGFDGDIDIPVIDWRHYLEDELDMHHSHQSFAARQRMLDADGDAGNQVIWFTDARPAVAFDQTPMAFEVIDEWMANIAAHPERSVAENKPGRRSTRASTPTATSSPRADVWDGVLDDGPAGACTQRFPIYSSTRGWRAGRSEGGVFKCRLQSVAPAIRTACTATGSRPPPSRPASSRSSPRRRRVPTAPPPPPPLARWAVSGPTPTPGWCLRRPAGCPWRWRAQPGDFRYPRGVLDLAVWAADRLDHRRAETRTGCRDLLVEAGCEPDRRRAGGRHARVGVRDSRARGAPTLPRRGRPTMRLLLCGLARPVRPADAGVAFARPGNRFWPAALAGFETPGGLVSVDRDPDPARSAITASA